MVLNSIFDAKVVLDITGKDSSVEFLFITPDISCNIEAFGLIYSNSDFTCEIFEGVTTSNDGVLSDNLAINIDRMAGNGHLMKLYSTPTITDYGKLIWVTRTWVSREPSGIHNNYSIMPLPSTKYVWKIIKNTAGTHFIDLDFWWRETLGVIV